MKKSILFLLVAFSIIAASCTKEVKSPVAKKNTEFMRKRSGVLPHPVIR